MNLRIFILGGGRFGTHLATRLSEFGAEVILADKSAQRVEDLAEDGFHAVQLDADDEAALKQANVQSADAVVVAIGENMQASILATLLLKEMKVRRLITRAVDEKHAQVLEKLGADLVLLPSRDMAYRLAERLRARSLSDRLPITDQYQLAHVRLGPRLHGSKLADARLPAEFRITVLLISRPLATEGADPGEKLAPKTKDMEPEPHLVLQQNDILVVSGLRENIDRFEQKCGLEDTLSQR